MLVYSRNIKFEDKPDYNYLRKHINNMALAEGIKFDDRFDWVEMQKDLKSNETNLAQETNVKEKNDSQIKILSNSNINSEVKKVA